MLPTSVSEPVLQTKRWYDFKNPGSQGDGSFLGFTDELKGTENGYPGGEWRRVAGLHHRRVIPRLHPPSQTFRNTAFADACCSSESCLQASGLTSWACPAATPPSTLSTR